MCCENTQFHSKLLHAHSVTSGGASCSLASSQPLLSEAFPNSGSFLCDESAVGGGAGGVLLTLSHLSGLSGRLTLMYEEI